MFEPSDSSFPNIEARQVGSASHESIHSFEQPLASDQSNEEYMVRYAERVSCEITSEEFEKLPREKQIDGLSLNNLGGTATGGWLNQLYAAPINLPHIEKMFSVLNTAYSSPVESFSSEKRERMAQILQTSMGASIQAIPENPDKDFFERTNVSRPFIKSGYGDKRLGLDDTAITKVLFGIPAFQFEFMGQPIEGAQEYIRSKINGKKIALFGGGSSVIDLVYNYVDFQPEIIINVDPHVIHADGFTSTPNPYTRIETSAGDPELQKIIGEVGVEQVDEIWATFSVPYYCPDAKQIEDVFENAKKLLAPGGTFRIYPYDLPIIGMHDIMHGTSPINGDGVFEIMELNDIRRKAYVKVVEDFNLDPEFNVSLINVSGMPGRATLLIQRIG